MFRWFESRLDPFPCDPPAQPPRGLYAFCRHYTRGAEKWLLLMALTTAGIAVAELALYAYVGSLVDRLGATTPATFIAAEGPRLLWMGALVLVALPLLVLVNALVQHQTLLGNFPMRIRWSVHRYLLRQSMGYFQDEFAGRIATKLMQTSLAVRETVVKLFDIGNYVLVFFIGTLAVAGSADWRMMLPFVGWLLGYALLMWHFVPRMERISREQADARSEMTGRIVDSYTNIATVKLFSHSRREQAYAREAMAGLVEGHVGILAQAIETAAGLFQAGTFRGASTRLLGLTWGPEDLSAELGAETNRDRDGRLTEPYRLARTVCLFAAAAAEVAAIETVYVDFRNIEGLRRDTEDARRDGFSGRLAIHPAQVAVINEVFTPTEAAIAHARAIVAAFAATPGTGVVAIEGVMYDRPHLARAQRLLANAGDAAIHGTL